ncbi:VOC family protein [Alteribacillus sp. YIM 98480]|uniref:VOC family protein n=1 Tax=Alteribacillus sp. YIM 98480 TaxID=2606599 RepID=UPI00131E79C3|nr:VOC family protein [Alteribacillus sp. YIM 98480]
MSQEKVIGFYHAGITVKNLKESLQFYCDWLGFELLSRQDVDQNYIFNIVGVHDLNKIKIAFLKIPGSHTLIELLEYDGVEKYSGSCRPCDYGSGHICLYVNNLIAMHKKLKNKGVRFKSGHPIYIDSGRNKGCYAIYMLDPDGFIVELIQTAD